MVLSHDFNYPQKNTEDTKQENSSPKASLDEFIIDKQAKLAQKKQYNQNRNAIRWKTIYTPYPHNVIHNSFYALSNLEIISQEELNIIEQSKNDVCDKLKMLYDSEVFDTEEKEHSLHWGIASGLFLGIAGFTAAMIARYTQASKETITTLFVSSILSIPIGFMIYGFHCKFFAKPRAEAEKRRIEHIDLDKAYEKLSTALEPLININIQGKTYNPKKMKEYEPKKVLEVLDIVQNYSKKVLNHLSQTSHHSKV